ncbi:MAG: carboxypeptidase-like regulatory domain-containing protein [Planctomycetota bacterium]|nr:carboxypeptidase-like regulatory domain-containing protein [Planctomycetota bacterium]
MPLKWKALLAVCAAAVMVCVVAVTRYVKVQGARDEAAQVEATRVAREAREAREAEGAAAKAQQAALAAASEVEAEPAAEPEAVESEAAAGAAQAKGPSQLVVQVDEAGRALADVLVEIANDAGVRLGEARTDAQGRASFAGLSAVRCTVRVEAPQGLWTSLRAELGASEVVAHVALGSARLDGRVWDRDGRVAVGAPLVVRQTVPESGNELVRELRTDVDGWYHCTNLALLPTRIEDADSSIPRVVQAELSHDAPARADLGQPDGKFEWRGRLVTSGGTWVDEPLELKLVENQRGWSMNVLCAADGSFATRLRTGDWVALATGVDGPFEVAKVALRDADVEQNAVLGTCLRLVLPQLERDRNLSEIAIALRPEDSDDVRELTPRGGRIVVAGVQPGRWKVDARRIGLEFEVESALEVDVAEGALVELSLDVRWAELP